MPNPTVEMESAHLMKCPHCNATVKIKVVGEALAVCYGIFCDCGIYTKLFNDTRPLIELWNTRRGKKFVLPDMIVTPPPTRGVSPKAQEKF